MDGGSKFVYFHDISLVCYVLLVCLHVEVFFKDSTTHTKCLELPI